MAVSERSNVAASFSRVGGGEISVDKIFEALSSASRRRILAFLSKTDMTAGEIAHVRLNDVAAGHLQWGLTARV